MKKQPFFLLICLSISAHLFSLSAQEKSFETPSKSHSIAFINSAELLDAMPDKSIAAEQLSKLNENYKAELKLMENEYNKKYSDFITYQGTLAENIKLRRMLELTELEQKMNDFMTLAQKDIEEQEQKMLAPLKIKLNDAIHIVGTEHGFTIIYDISDSGIAFVTPQAIDATPFVKKKLRIK